MCNKWINYTILNLKNAWNFLTTCIWLNSSSIFTAYTKTSYQTVARTAGNKKIANYSLKLKFVGEKSLITGNFGSYFSLVLSRCSTHHRNTRGIRGVQLPRGIPRRTSCAVCVTVGEEGRRHGRISSSALFLWWPTDLIMGFDGNTTMTWWGKTQ